MARLLVRVPARGWAGAWARGVVTVLLAVLAIGASASAASAAAGNASISLTGVPASFPQGQQVVLSSSLSVPLSADISSVFRSVSVTFYVQADDLTGSQIQFSWKRDADRSWHNNGLSRKNGLLQTSFSPLGTRLTASQANLQLRVEFRPSAKAQQIQVGVVLYGTQQHNGSQQLAQAGPFASAIGAAVVIPSPTPSQPPTTAPATQGATAQGSDPAAVLVPAGTDNAQPSTGQSNVGWILYLIGGLLLIAGIGIVGTMLWRRARRDQDWAGVEYGYPVSDAEYPPQAYPESGYGQPQPDRPPSSLLYPTKPYPQQPPMGHTQKMPPIQ